jgi:hypothetical protein
MIETTEAVSDVVEEEEEEIKESERVPTVLVHRAEDLGV